VYFFRKIQNQSEESGWQKKQGQNRKKEWYFLPKKIVDCYTAKISRAA